MANFGANILCIIIIPLLEKTFTLRIEYLIMEVKEPGLITSN
jgi:hypothetical protein